MLDICIPGIDKEQIENGTISQTRRFIPFTETKLYNDLGEYRLRNKSTYEEETEDKVSNSSKKDICNDDSTTNIRLLEILDNILEDTYTFYLYVDSISHFLLSKDVVSNIDDKDAQNSTYDLLMYLGDEEHVSIPSFVRNIKVRKYSPFILNPSIKVVSNESKFDLDFKELFKDFQGESLTFINFDTTHVYNMERMFMGCDKLIHLNLGDNFNTVNVKNMGGMFYLCDSLIKLDLGDKFYTNKVINMEFMFSYCRSLIYLRLGDNFNTGNVENMEGLFSYCDSLLKLDLGYEFDTSKVKFMRDIFAECLSLRELNLCSKFKFIQKGYASKTTVVSEDAIKILNKFFPGCESLILVKVNGSDESLQKLIYSIQNTLINHQNTEFLDQRL